MHKVTSIVTSGSPGDLGKIAQELARADINIDAIGGGEGDLNGTPVGIISMLVTSDEGQQDVGAIIQGLNLSDVPGETHFVVSAVEHDALDLELDDSPGRLGVAASLLGNANPPIDIMGVLTVDVHVGKGIVSLGFKDEFERDRARDVLTTGQFTVLEPHGGRARRQEVDAILEANP